MTGLQGGRTVLEAIGFNDLLCLIDDVGHVNLGVEIRLMGIILKQQTLTPTTCFAPALAANILRIPVPHPTSSTVFPLKRWGLLMIAERYDPVRTESFNISS